MKRRFDKTGLPKRGQTNGVSQEKQHGQQVGGCVEDVRVRWGTEIQQLLFLVDDGTSAQVRWNLDFVVVGALVIVSRVLRTVEANSVQVKGNLH